MPDTVELVVALGKKVLHFPRSSRIGRDFFENVHAVLPASSPVQCERQVVPRGVAIAVGARGHLEVPDRVSQLPRVGGQRPQVEIRGSFFWIRCQSIPEMTHRFRAAAELQGRQTAQAHECRRQPAVARHGVERGCRPGELARQKLRGSQVGEQERLRIPRGDPHQVACGQPRLAAANTGGSDGARDFERDFWIGGESVEQFPGGPQVA